MPDTSSFLFIPILKYCCAQLSQLLKDPTRSHENECINNFTKKKGDNFSNSYTQAEQGIIL